MDIYVVQPGDTIDQIASQNDGNVYQIIADNQLVYPYQLAVGQALLVRKARTMLQKKAGYPLLVGGYAYPFINQEVLGDTLPYLSRINVFSYGFYPDGRLLPPGAEDGFMINQALYAGVSPFMTLTPIDASGHFNSNLVSVLVKDYQMQKKLVSQILLTMRQKGFQGLDIDFEYVNGEDRIAFADFVGYCRDTLNTYGYMVTVALAPKTSADQRGQLYEGIDYRRLGQAANEVFLMTYEWGYTYGPPMAVAPIHKVRQVVEYAVSEIPRNKISLGIPNYGYDWPLPYERGMTKAITLGNVEAARLAAEKGAQIHFDTLSASPYFYYTEQGISHEVWFEDVRSLMAKFDLIKAYGLKGAGYWQLMRFFKANWLLLEQNFAISRFALKN